MIPELEGQHTWKPASLWTPSDRLVPFALNRDERGEWPKVRLNRITGLHSRADMDDARDPLTGRLGEIPRKALLRGKSVVYEGVIADRDIDGLDRVREDMLAAFAETEEGTMVVQRTQAETQALYPAETIYPSAHTYPGGRGNGWTYTARVTQCEIPAQLVSPFRASLGWERPFTLGLRMSDPRFFDVTERSVKVAESGPGLSVPAIAGEVLVQGQATADGRAPADPIFVLTGPAAAGFYLEHEELGVSLVFTGTLSLTDVLVVDFEHRLITLNNVEAAGRYDDELSDWWDDGVPGFVGGVNTFRYGGALSGATARARWRDAHWN